MKTSRFIMLSAITAAGIISAFAGKASAQDTHTGHGDQVAVPPTKAPASSTGQKAATDTVSTKERAPQTTCPVMEGQAINKKFYADHEGKRVYFCCKSCVDTFKKDPAKYMKKLESMGQAPEKIASTSENSTKKDALVAQTTCPVMGGKINKSMFVDVDGQRIYVCCEACIAEVKKNPDLYIKKLESSGQKAETIAK